MATLVVKLGGAAITDKSKADTLSDNLNTLVDTIARVYRTELRPRGSGIVLIHGAGSFGHPPAKKFRVKTGWETTRPATTGADGQDDDDDDDVDGETGHERKRRPAQQHQQQRENPDVVKYGMALTRQRVLHLHHHLLRRIHDRTQLPVLSISTYDTVETHEGQLTPESSARLVSRVRRLLAQGFIPLLFGDAVFDLAWGATILSGDALMHALATELREVHRCVFVTDVAGIYTRDPKRFADATLVRRLHCSSEQGVLDDGQESTSAVDDVTGAMGSKWQWAKRIMADAPHVGNVVICRASEAGGALAVPDDGVDGDEERSHDAYQWTCIVR
ncbi:hypothetical protein E4U42_006818 [Claviceps africana]|uniref:Aspartate/glutamate/uridylate kinase domain-containing protein n=1 Tax=Claviceps africana TaxID=83212 RepID=A0A8K0J2J2_9HYPO|nr:hypothetical protein E4U42_006818 [Claviceps africana]